MERIHDKIVYAYSYCVCLCYLSDRAGMAHLRQHCDQVTRQHLLLLGNGYGSNQCPTLRSAALAVLTLQYNLDEPPRGRTILFLHLLQFRSLQLPQDAITLRDHRCVSARRTQRAEITGDGARDHCLLDQGPMIVVQVCRAQGSAFNQVQSIRLVALVPQYGSVAGDDLGEVRGELVEELDGLDVGYSGVGLV